MPELSVGPLVFVVRTSEMKTRSLYPYTSVPWQKHGSSSSRNAGEGAMWWPGDRAAAAPQLRSALPARRDTYSVCAQI